MLFYPGGGFPLASSSGGAPDVGPSSTGSQIDPTAFLKQMMLMRALQGGAGGAAQAMGGGSPLGAGLMGGAAAAAPQGLMQGLASGVGPGLQAASIQPVLARLMQMSRPPLPQQPGQPQMGIGGMPISQP